MNIAVKIVKMHHTLRNNHVKRQCWEHYDFHESESECESLGHESKSESESIKAEIYESECESESTCYESESECESDSVNSSPVKFSP